MSWANIITINININIIIIIIIIIITIIIRAEVWPISLTIKILFSSY